MGLMPHIYLAALLALIQAAPAGTPLGAVDGLLQADRDFAKWGVTIPAVDAISSMFADDVMVPAPGNVLVHGKGKAIEALKANPDNLTGRVEWAPIRGGISADGTHGFTFGYLTLTKADKSTMPLKYLAYWIKGPDGWRIAAYRRRPRPEGTVSTEMMRPSVPGAASLEPMPADASRVKAFGESLSAAEQAFSDEAQKIGIAAAFARNGSSDAVNMGGPKDVGFVLGSEAIGRSVGEGSPTDRSEVVWSADRVLVAPSGDLGITFGMIRILQPKAGQPAAVPFFTIWRRDSPSQPWRYIAE